MSCKIGIFADDTRTVKAVSDINDALDLQSDLDDLYEWADTNNMAFNGLKFECLKYGGNDTLKSTYDYITPSASTSIEDYSNV